MSSAPPPPDNSAEILRQAQALIEAQQEARSSLERKLMGLLQVGVTLGAASAAAASTAVVPGGWLPAWAGVGFVAAALGFFAAALLAALGLNNPEIGAPAIQPRKLVAEGRLLDVPARDFHLAVAFELDAVIDSNAALARRASRRFYQALRLALWAAPVGCICGVVWLLPPDMRGGVVTLGVTAAGAVLLQRAWGRTGQGPSPPPR